MSRKVDRTKPWRAWALALCLCAGLLNACAEESSEGDSFSDEGPQAGASEADEGMSVSGEAAPEPSVRPRLPDTISADIEVENVPDAGDGDSGPEAVESGKGDDGYWVPPDVALRGQVVVDSGRAAWVERTDEGAQSTLVLWDIAAGKAPEAFRTPNLANPSQLVLSDTWLVYVDDRYGDSDLFALNLASGLEEAVVTEPGAQVEPALFGDVLAWRDCRECQTGAPSAAEIYSVDLASGDEIQRVTTSTADERSPALGQLPDGRDILVWIEGERRIRVRGDGLDEIFEAGSFVSTIDLASGLILWREATGLINPDSMKPIEINPDSMKPIVGINPDSMFPSDVFGTDALTGVTHPVSVHAELSPELLGRVHASGGRVAWLEANPDAELAPRLVLADAASAKVLQSIDTTGLWNPSLSKGLMAFVAPRADNAGLDDVWILPLDGLSP